MTREELIKSLESFGFSIELAILLSNLPVSTQVKIQLAEKIEEEIEEKISNCSSALDE